MPKGRKTKANLKKRINSYEATVARLKDSDARGFRKPGSRSGRK